MARFKIHLKLQGFDLDIEGSREDVPLIAASVGQQIAGLIEPAAHIVEGETDRHQSPVLDPSAVEQKDRRTRSIKRKRPRPTSAPSASDSQSSMLSWTHDTTKWGFPKQSWPTATKAIWLLYVASKVLNTTEMTSTQIAETFNHHFKQAKTIRAHNVTRDLGKQRGGPDAPVSQDTSKADEPWFLTTAGISKGEELVAEALSPNYASAK